jgi:hypothetical protein
MSLRGGEDRRRHLHLAHTCPAPVPDGKVSGRRKCDLLSKSGVQVSNLRYELGIASPSFDYAATTSSAAQDGSQ